MKKIANKEIKKDKIIEEKELNKQEKEVIIQEKQFNQLNEMIKKNEIIENNPKKK